MLENWAPMLGGPNSKNIVFSNVEEIVQPHLLAFAMNANKMKSFPNANFQLFFSNLSAESQLKV